MQPDTNRPSKQFLIRGGIAIGVLAIVLIVQTSWFRALFSSDTDESRVTVDNTTVGDILNQDTNGNGIPDWEEKLWGLDPTVLYTHGISNRQIIEDKKASLGVSGTATTPTNETDRLSRELYTLAIALGQSDAVDSATLQEIAANFGSSIDTNLVTNKYSSKDIQTIQTTSQSLTTYSTQVKNILSRYSKGDDDIAIIVQAIETEDTSGLEALTATRAQYIKLTKELAAVRTPVGVANYHLDIINGIAGVGDSFEIIQQLSDNGISALIGVALYKNYNTKLDTAVIGLTDYLSEYGILQQ